MHEVEWDLSVSSRPRLLDIKLKELIRYRDLIFMFFFRDFITTYKQTVLGPLWHIVSPLCQTVVYAFVFGNIAGIGTDGVPKLLFYYSGTMLWTLFSTSLNTASGIFINNAGVFGKVYFPRLTVPIATSMSAVLKMLVQFAMLMAFFVYFILAGRDVRPTALAFLFPLMVIWLCALGTGLGMIMSALTTKYRDLSHVLGLILQLTMFVTPVVYPLSQVPERFKSFFYANPLSAPMEIFRIWFYGVGNVPLEMIVISISVTIVSLFLGLILFSRNSRTFMDVI